MRIVVVVQARLGSSRLPAKVLLDLAGRPALERCLARARRMENVADVVVATSDQPVDDIVALASLRFGHQVIRGSADDVLGRFTRVIDQLKPDAIVRITSDCPLIDPALSSEVIAAFIKCAADGNPADYASNVMTRRLPRGLDTEVISSEALMRAAHDAHAPSEREHVTQHIYRNPATFKCIDVSGTGPDLSRHRWTLDTLADYSLLYRIFNELREPAEAASVHDVLEILARRPELLTINDHIAQKLT